MEAELAVALSIDGICNYDRSRRRARRRSFVPAVRKEFQPVKIKVVVHEAEEGGCWAEVPALPGCATEGEAMEALLANLREAIEGCLSVDVADEKTRDDGRVVEIAI